ncbi:MAG: VanZ family protein [Bacteroidaceae bacterium]|jgi:VanZ family protein|nr:VanZ family protein [Bacteroidaceae bacterium]
MIKYICKYPFSLLVIVAILFLSLFNPPETRLDDVTFIDKIAHVCMYGGLELIIWVEYLRRHADLNKVKFILLGIAAPIALGGIMELAQMLLTVNRSGEWADFIADTLGVLAGAAAGLFILRPLIWRKR